MIKRTSNARTHGRTGTPEHRSWMSMRNRCNNKNNPAYDSYGGKGISVCERWNKFESFFSDMGVRPNLRYTLDRKDNSKGYTPDNCRWATWEEQNRNKSNVALLEYHGLVLPRWLWSILSGIKRGTIDSRIRAGWSMKDALNKPVYKSKLTRNKSNGKSKHK